jgi:AGZA family xanthine/uracil permease-like MFS transporter
MSVAALCERWFGLAAKDTTPGREALAGVTTFMTMAYILFANPGILGDVVDRDGVRLAPAAVMSATALVAAVMTAAMGLVANVPLALAAGMGLNAVVAYQLVGTLQLSWAEAMGVVVAEGLVITLLVVTGAREAVLRALPDGVKRAVGIGIGLFLTFIGLFNAGFVTKPPHGPLPVQLGQGGHLVGWPMLVFVLGFLFTSVLVARRVRAAFVLGILGTTALAMIVNATAGGWSGPVARLPERLVAAPDLSLVGSFSFGFVAKLGGAVAALTVLSLMLSDFFDSMGTVVAVGRQAGFVDAQGQVPRARAILLVDSLAAVVGGAAGASSATSYIESATGVAAGGRTGLTSLVTALCFLAALAFSPLAAIVPAQATAPTLVLVGLLMMRDIGSLPWDEPAEAIPAFLGVVVMPFTFSITNGIGAACVAHAALSVARGRAREVHPALFVCAAAFVVYFVWGA